MINFNLINRPPILRLNKDSYKYRGKNYNHLNRFWIKNKKIIPSNKMIFKDIEEENNKN
jgi:hypothetical protein